MSKYKTIYIVSYVGEYELKKSRKIIQVDSIEDFDKELYEIISKHLQKRFSISEDYISFLSYISGTEEQLRKIAFENSKYLYDILEEPYGVGADDGHFDYFPDLVDQFRQLCEQIGEIELYNLTIRDLKEHYEYNECEEVTFDKL